MTDILLCLYCAAVNENDSSPSELTTSEYNLVLHIILNQIPFHLSLGFIGPPGRSRESHDSNDDDDDDDDVAMDPEAQQDDQKRKGCSHIFGCNVMTGAPHLLISKTDVLIWADFAYWTNVRLTLCGRSLLSTAITSLHIMQ